MSKKILIIASACSVPSGAMGSVIYDADFTQDVMIDHDTDANSLESSPQAGANFTIGYDTTPDSDTTVNEFGTRENSLFSQDFGGEHFMVSEIIDVSNWDEVSINVVGDYLGTDSFNDSPTEFIEYVYTLGGGSEQQFFYFTDDPNGTNLDATVASLDVTGTSMMTVGLNANVNGAGDGFDISNYTVTGVSAIPETSTTLPLAALCAAGLFARRRK